MTSLESDGWQPVANIEEEKAKAETAARNTIKKNKQIKQRLTQKAKES